MWSCGDPARIPAAGTCKASHSLGARCPRLAPELDVWSQEAARCFSMASLHIISPLQEIVFVPEQWGWGQGDVSPGAHQDRTHKARRWFSLFRSGLVWS